MNKIKASFVLLLAAISSGYLMYSIFKKAGFEDIFDFDLNEDIDETL